MYIKQLLKSKPKSLSLYLPIPLMFFILMVQNYLVIKLLKLDVNQIIKAEIKEKGVNEFFIENGQMKNKELSLFLYKLIL